MRWNSEKPFFSSSKHDFIPHHQLLGKRICKTTNTFHSLVKRLFKIHILFLCTNPAQWIVIGPRRWRRSGWLGQRRQFTSLENINMLRLINDLPEKVSLPFNFLFISTFERNTSPSYWPRGRSLCSVMQFSKHLHQKRGVNLFLAHNHCSHNLSKYEVYPV